MYVRVKKEFIHLYWSEFFVWISLSVKKSNLLEFMVFWDKRVFFLVCWLILVAPLWLLELDKCLVFMHHNWIGVSKNSNLDSKFGFEILVSDWLVNKRSSQVACILLHLHKQLESYERYTTSYLKLETVILSCMFLSG